MLFSSVYKPLAFTLQASVCVYLPPNLSTNAITDSSLLTLQMEFFQDDIYPDTTVTWQAALTGREWLDGGNKLQGSISMRPADMKLCEYKSEK